MIREEAATQLELVNQAMSRIGPEADRAAYDQSLALYHAEQELFQPLSDVDLYQIFGLAPAMAGEQVEHVARRKGS